MTDIVLKRIAKVVALHCFRNTHLENLHSGITPSTKSGDYSDVKVVTPYGEIEWKNLSRLSDAEMKVLMIDVVNHTYSFLKALTDTRFAKELLNAIEKNDIQPDWNDPEEIDYFGGGKRANGNYDTLIEYLINKLNYKK